MKPKCSVQKPCVWIPKYRRKSLYGKVRADIREILRTLCKYKNVEIIAGNTPKTVGVRFRRIFKRQVSIADIR